MSNNGYVLIAILAAASATGAIPAFAANELACPDCVEGGHDKLESYKKLLPVVVWTDKAVYDQKSTIVVSGHVRNPNPDMAVTMKVVGPTGNVVKVEQLTFDSNGDFETTLNTVSPLWTQSGVYTITAQYGGESRASEVKVQLSEVIPEFGPIAALVLAVAIISIIAVSAKTRLRLMPKY